MVHGIGGIFLLFSLFELRTLGMKNLEIKLKLWIKLIHLFSCAHENESKRTVVDQWVMIDTKPKMEEIPML